MVDAGDNCGRKHLLPFYLTKLATPDQNNLEPEQGENFLLKSVQGSVLKLKRGIRTLGESAHFVRCIPLSKDVDESVWAPPPVLLLMKSG